MTKLATEYTKQISFNLYPMHIDMIKALVELSQEEAKKRGEPLPSRSDVLRLLIEKAYKETIQKPKTKTDK